MRTEESYNKFINTVDSPALSTNISSRCMNHRSWDSLNSSVDQICSNVILVMTAKQSDRTLYADQ